MRIFQNAIYFYIKKVYKTATKNVDIRILQCIMRPKLGQAYNSFAYKMARDTPFLVCRREDPLIR